MNIMQELLSIDWLVLATLCAATAAAAVWWLTPNPKPKGFEQDLLQGDGQSDAVFLFDDTTLIGWSSGARRFIGEQAENFSWANLRDQLSADRGTHLTEGHYGGSSKSSDSWLDLYTDRSRCI